MRFPAKIMRGERPRFSLHTSLVPAKSLRGDRPPTQTAVDGVLIDGVIPAIPCSALTSDCGAA